MILASFETLFAFLVQISFYRATLC